MGGDECLVLGLILAFVVITAPVVAQHGRDRGRIPGRGVQHKTPLPCEQGSCLPATGDLLIGREDRLSASSTCGMKGPERFCIVSHLSSERKKCFYCNGASPKQQHRVENIVHKYIPGTDQASWWQSENGVENVTLQLDLEAEFRFTHIIIRFQTFRPAAMLIERSSDFGKTWQVYKYFAHNCEQSFPGISTSTPRRLTDVVCDSRYSTVDPSTDGEIIFRVLSPNLQIDNPYSKEVQHLLKMTNLRINFTRLHTLGDDLLDNRSEIREKYYYAIKDMVVRGSCSCYGHASRCLPLAGIRNRQDMVHGRCECTHNTKGLNCQFCEDFYNDLPWKPAFGKQTNACKKCHCNNHADTCHFDQSVYERSGRVSGGVCDQCKHHTRGLNCEQCEPFFYHDLTRDMSDPEVCQPCDCDPAGSVDDGICDSLTDLLRGNESGRCHCKANVEGRRCDRCKPGFWNFSPDNPEGCEACTCNTLGTVNNQGCDLLTGKCTCKLYVIGRNCDQCFPEYWGLSDDLEGCKPCACDLGGAYNNSCNILTGQCPCRPHVDGRSCDQPAQNHYTVALDFLVYEGEHGRSNHSQVVIREPPRGGRPPTWTGPGFIRTFEDSTLQFVVDDIRKSMEYDIVIRYEPELTGLMEDVEIFIERDEDVDPDGPCAKWNPQDDVLVAQIPANSRSTVAAPSVCLEEGKRYLVLLRFRTSSVHAGSPTASILVDSIVLMPKPQGIPFFTESPPAEVRKEEYERNHCEDVFYNVIPSLETNDVDICDKYWKSIGYYVFNGAHPCECNPTGSLSLLCNQNGGSCSCKPNVVGRRCDQCAPGTYGFSPSGCVACDCDSVGSLDNICDEKTGRCKCHPNTYGRTCGECEPGFWNFPRCQRCECNGHAVTCDAVTGACHDCQDFTTGARCDRCAETFYGDPRIGVDIPCRACPCPGTVGSGHSYADVCSLDAITLDVVCECYAGYAGPRCDTCADNYFGHPEVPGGICVPCDCSNNTDPSRPGNCNPHTGRCLQCLYDTDGPNCQTCRAGFWGDALRQECSDCNCNVLGTDPLAGPCDPRTGQCPCLPRVLGQYCDQCEENHWRIASGEGCDPCDCDPNGSLSEKCNEFDGTCECRPGFGGRKCNQCQKNFWGNPNIECNPCECDLIGSSTPQCDKDTGACVCHAGIGGEKCDHCDRGWVGTAPICSHCGECFENWDHILHGLTNRTRDVIEAASMIQNVGTSGVYSQEFEFMDDALRQVENLITRAEVTAEDIDKLQELAAELNNITLTSSSRLDELDAFLQSISQRVILGEGALQSMRKGTASLIQTAGELKSNATTLQESDVYGALNVTYQMGQQSMEAVELAENSSIILADADRYQRNTDILVAKTSSSFTETFDNNKNSLQELENKLNEFSVVIPDLNLEMCGKSVQECDDLCGGAGCPTCGGLSCNAGAITDAERALDLAKQRSAGLKKHKEEAEQLLRNMTQMKDDATSAREVAKEALDVSSEAFNVSGETSKRISSLNDRIIGALNEDQSTPSMVRDLAETVLKKNIILNPEAIKSLADSIQSIVGSLTDSDQILRDTADDLQQAEVLRDKALEAKNSAVAQDMLAGNVIVLLSEAEVAAESARAAIENVATDISAAKKDLEDVNSVVEVAKDSANNSTAEISRLEVRLTELQTLVAKNDFIMTQEIAEDVRSVEVEARETRQKTEMLIEDFEETSESLKLRTGQSEGGIVRAKSLLERASGLAADTTTKFKDITGMEGVYFDNEKTLADLAAEVEALTRQMEIHFNEIEMKSQIYSRCSA